MKDGVGKRGMWKLSLIALALMLAACGGSGGEPAEDGDQVVCDCPGNLPCDAEGVCIPECGNDFDCPTGQFCDRDQGLCQDRPTDSDGDLDDGGETPDPDGDVNTEEPERDFPDLDGDSDYDLVFETDVEHDAVNPWVQVEPAELDFGAVPVGGSLTLPVTIHNIGDAKLEVSEIFLWDDSSELILDHPDTPFEILRQQSLAFDVTYAPTDSQAETNLLVIGTNDPSEPNIGVPIITEVKQTPRLRVDPDPIALGLVRLTESRHAVALHNDGGAELHVSGLTVTEASDPELSLAGLVNEPSPTNPLVVGAGNAATVEVVVTAVEEGDVSGQLRVQSDDPEAGVVLVDISATVCEPEIEVSPESVDFAGVHFGESDTRTVTVENSGCYPLELTTIELGSATTADFTFESRPDDGATLAEGESLSIELRYTPDNEGFDLGSLVLTTNDADEPRVIIPLVSDPTPPDIDVQPPELTFAALASGESVIKTLTVSNTATGGLLILHDFVLETEGTVFYKANFPVDQLGPGQASVVKIGYRPDDVGSDSGSLHIFSNDADESEVVVPLSGGGISDNQCPVAVAGEDRQVEPLENLQLDGTGSYDPDGTVTGYLWRVESKPYGSRAFPVPMNIAEPNFFFDIAGEYVLSLTVQDNEGMQSCEADEITFNAVPTEKIHIQLVWDTDNTDMDIHLVKPGGALWDGYDHGGAYPVSYGDCFFSTCKKEFEPSGNPVDWSANGWPSLDIDDQNGYGPENINLNDPGDGDYGVYVHYWNDRGNGATTATLRIYLLGELRFTGAVAFTEEHLLWKVADIRWMAGGGSGFTKRKQPDPR